MSNTVKLLPSPVHPSVFIEEGLRATPIQVRHYAELVGKTIKAVHFESYEGEVLPVLMIEDGPLVGVCVMCDPEGNGPGHLDIIHR